MGMIVLMGALGGAANALLIEDGFALPRFVQRDKDKRSWNPGVFGNIFLGVLAALATYYLGASALPDANQLGIALVSGLGGGNILTSLVQKYQSATLKTQLETLEEELKRALRPPDHL